jgi:GNAT superfamily N-acetyltransferase
MISDRRRILVIANETVEGDVLHETIRFNASEARTAEVLVIAPALNSRVRHWISDEDEARRRAELRLAVCIDRLAAAGIEAIGWVGDADPLRAIQDALHFFAADVIIIATHPEGRSHWLARNVVGRARLRFAQPIRHVVVDVGGGQEVAAA